jgi:hypothetical protein
MSRETIHDTSRLNKRDELQPNTLEDREGIKRGKSLKTPLVRAAGYWEEGVRGSKRSVFKNVVEVTRKIGYGEFVKVWRNDGDEKG